MEKNFIEVTGFIRSVQHFNGDILLEIWDGKDKDHVTNLIINQFTVLTTLIGEELEVTDDLKDCYLTAYVNRRKPVLAIYPPRFYPELVAIRVKDQFGFVQFGFFNEDLFSEQLNIKLTIGEETEIVDSFGEPLEASYIQNNYAFIYYTRSTRSIPAQVPAIKVVVYEDPFGKMQDQRSN